MSCTDTVNRDIRPLVDTPVPSRLSRCLRFVCQLRPGAFVTRRGVDPQRQAGRLSDPCGSDRRPVQDSPDRNTRPPAGYFFFLTTFFVTFGQVTTGFLPFRFTTVQAFGVALATVMPTDTDRITLSAVKPDTCTV